MNGNKYLKCSACGAEYPATEKDTEGMAVCYMCKKECWFDITEYNYTHTTQCRACGKILTDNNRLADDGRYCADDYHAAHRAEIADRMQQNAWAEQDVKEGY